MGTVYLLPFMCHAEASEPSPSSLQTSKRYGHRLRALFLSNLNQDGNPKANIHKLVLVFVI